MRNELYLIEDSTGSSDCRDYAEHGEMGGVPEAIGYETPAHARKFRMEDDALNFIHADLPERRRGHHRPVSITLFVWDASVLAVMLNQGIDIPDKIYKAPGGGFYRREDSPRLKEMMDRFDRELEKAIATDETGDGFIYEMCATCSSMSQN